MTHPIHPDHADDRPLSPDEERQLDAALGLVRAQSAEETALFALVQTVRRIEDADVSGPSAASIQAVLAAVDQRIDAQLAATRVSTWQLFRIGLRNNMLMRVAAASLLVHLAALPVLAWLHYTNPERPALNIYFERNLPLPIAEEEDEILLPLELPPDELELPAVESFGDNGLDLLDPK